MIDSIFDKNDVLLRDEVNSSDGAWLQTSSPKLSSYAEGYETVVNHIFELLDCNISNNLIVYPIIYIAIHYIEIKLKELYSLGFHYLSSTNPSYTIDTFKNGHDLKELWDNYNRDIISNIKEINSNDITEITRIFHEFKLEDPSSQAYRYPFSSKKERDRLITRDTADLKNFKKIIQKFIVYFGWHSEAIYSLIEISNGC